MREYGESVSASDDSVRRDEIILVTVALLLSWCMSLAGYPESSRIILRLGPANEWACGRTCEHQLSLASFVMPNHPSVEELVPAACLHLPAEHGAEQSLRAIYDHLLARW
jgi:hypothetical protein